MCSFLGTSGSEGTTTAAAATTTTVEGSNTVRVYTFPPVTWLGGWPASAAERTC